MSDGVEADFSTLQAASRTWDDAADRLDGAWRRLHGTSGAPMDPGVSGAFEAFRETWVDEVKRVAVAAQGHAESLDDAASSYEAMDRAAYEQLRALLPFDYRDSTLDPDGGPPPAPPMPTPGPAPTPSPGP